MEFQNKTAISTGAASGMGRLFAQNWAALLYHIQLPDKQILVDSGCDTMPGFAVEDFVLPPLALKKTE